MSQQLRGNLKGLAPSELRRLEKLYMRRLGKEELLSLDLARELFELASSLRRRIGLLISREGRILEVAVGSKDILYLPDLGRYRLGAGRLRRLRLIFSDLSNDAEPARIPADIYTDLEKLRLDAVVAVKPLKNRVTVGFAHLLPPRADDPSAPQLHTEIVPDLAQFDLDYACFMSDLEAELSATRERGRSTGKSGAVLVGVYGKKDQDWEISMAELEELARTAGVEVLHKIVQRRQPDPKTLLGKGKLEEVVLTCLRVGAEIAIFDAELKPSQWRSIVNQTEIKVIDRSMLILDIFAQRATSSDGRLQVELAQLKYNLPRLVEKDAGLSRLTGGIGGRGPGETKLEIGRRRIRDRIVDLERRIDQLGGQRSLRRRRRQENQLPLIAILGYTNVGKSTLFNKLTGSSVIAENKLFATLDPAQRRLVLPSPDPTSYGREAVISDTVGFIRQLPNELVNAFRATLEELNDATALVHVIDATDPNVMARMDAVEGILAELELVDIPVIVTLNKIDRCDREEVAKLARATGGVAVSAKTGEGLDELIGRINGALVVAPKVEESAGDELTG